MEENSQWDFLDFVSSKYTHFLSREYDPLKPLDYHSAVRMVRDFKRSQRSQHLQDTQETNQELEPVSSKATLLIKEDADEAYRRRAGGIVQEELKEDGNSRVLLFYRIENSGMELEIKSQILKIVEPFGKILEIMLDRVPEYVGLPPQDSLRVYVKFKDLNSSIKAYKSLLESKINGESFVVEYFDEASFDERDFY